MLFALKFRNEPPEPCCRAQATWLTELSKSFLRAFESAISSSLEA